MAFWAVFIGGGYFEGLGWSEGTTAGSNQYTVEARKLEYDCPPKPKGLRRRTASLHRPRPPCSNPEGPSTQYLSCLVPNTIKSMVSGSKSPKYWVLGPSEKLFERACVWVPNEKQTVRQSDPPDRQSDSQTHQADSQTVRQRVPQSPEGSQVPTIGSLGFL